MKTTAKILAILFILMTGTALTSQKTMAGPWFSYQVFYDELSPYGYWVETPEYGYVWVPEAGQGFFPYSTGGYWVYTLYGWTWVSEYSWGWAPFHYGRWYYDPWYGWAWVPGREWSPGWVTWRTGGGYFGWAPLTPGFNVSITVGMNLYIPADHWCFIPDRYFGRPDMHRYYVNRLDNDRIYRQSNYIEHSTRDPRSNTRYYAGPDVRDISRVTGREIRPVEVRDNNKPGESLRGSQLSIYRPEVRDNPSGLTRKPAPARVETYRGGGNISTPVRNDRPAVEKPATTRKGTTPVPAAEPRENRPASSTGRNTETRKETQAPSKAVEPVKPATRTEKQGSGRQVEKPGAKTPRPSGTEVQPGRDTKGKAEPRKEAGGNAKGKNEEGRNRR